MNSICGADCSVCNFNKGCNGCTATNGCPFGKQCFIAEYIRLGGTERFEEFKLTLIKEINGLHVPGLPEVTELFPLCGKYVNLPYRLPSGSNIKFLDNCKIYLGTQIACAFGIERCFGVVAGTDFILISEYGKQGTDPELVTYVRR